MMPILAMPTCGCQMVERPQCRCAIWLRRAHHLQNPFPLEEPHPLVSLPQVLLRPGVTWTSQARPSGMMPPARATGTRPLRGASRSSTLGGVDRSGPLDASTYDDEYMADEFAVYPPLPSSPEEHLQCIPTACYIYNGWTMYPCSLFLSRPRWAWWTRCIRFLPSPA